KAMLIEFCALTGNEETGLSVLRELLAFSLRLRRPNGTMEFATAAAVLLRRLLADGRGGETVQANGSDLTWSVAELCHQMESTARDLAARFDARNGTTHQGDRIRARLGADPVVEFLPLTPGARRPVRPAIPSGLPPETMLDRAEWHKRRFESALARRYLAAVGTPPPHLAARHAELSALIESRQDDPKRAEEQLRWAAEAYRQTGDQRRHLVCLCRLADLLCEHGRHHEGLPIVARAVVALRRGGDDAVIAQGELLQAQSLSSAGQYQQGDLALARAIWHANACGDPILIGMTALTEATWRDSDGYPPAHVITLADTARAAFAAADSPGQLVMAYELRRRAHERAGAPHHFTELIERDLAALPPSAPAQLRGYLRYRRGVALIHAGRPAEALEDLIDGVGEARSRDADTAEQGYELA
ncbi:hypothetical protein, partial [Nonomuraea sp. NPDC049695]|uniref:hypothetical protein n=1 Tax=Nonomuraea sp. NPDC049695 TaxID=3154734 RepID=UPI0034132E0E